MDVKVEYSLSDRHEAVITSLQGTTYIVSISYMFWLNMFQDSVTLSSGEFFDKYGILPKAN